MTFAEVLGRLLSGQYPRDGYRRSEWSERRHILLFGASSSPLGKVIAVRREADSAVGPWTPTQADMLSDDWDTYNVWDDPA